MVESHAYLTACDHEPALWFSVFALPESYTGPPLISRVQSIFYCGVLAGAMERAVVVYPRNPKT